MALQSIGFYQYFDNPLFMNIFLGAKTPNNRLPEKGGDCRLIHMKTTMSLRYSADELFVLLTKAAGNVQDSVWSEKIIAIELAKLAQVFAAKGYLDLSKQISTFRDRFDNKMIRRYELANELRRLQRVANKVLQDVKERRPKVERLQKAS